MGYCSIRQQYSPELVTERAIGSPAALAALLARGTQIGLEVGTFLAALWLDSLSGQAEDSAKVKLRATQLRDLLTRLGPTYIKAGQVGGRWLPGSSGWQRAQVQQGAAGVRAGRGIAWRQVPADSSRKQPMSISAYVNIIASPSIAVPPTVPPLPVPPPRRCWPTAPTLCVRTT
jgi:hypothetical protein